MTSERPLYQFHFSTREMNVYGLEVSSAGCNCCRTDYDFWGNTKPNIVQINELITQIDGDIKESVILKSKLLKERT